MALNIKVTPKSKIQITEVTNKAGICAVPGNQILVTTDDSYRANWIIGEELSGVINGVNTNFTTANAIYDGKIVVYLNGLRLAPDHFTVNTATSISLNDAPISGDELIVDYIKS